jgi:ferric-chelate reductase
MHMYSDSHELHIYCGWTIFICAIIHTIAHIARWAAQGNLSLLVMHISGVTGLIIILSCLMICIPMTLFRKQIKYEVRKRLHYLFILFAGALAFHTPKSAVPNGGFTAYVFGGLLVWYFLDATYCYFFMTEKIDTTRFSVLPSGVRMTMNVSERFQKAGAKGGICYVCLPWISKNQWHAFSLFENPSNPGERQIFIQKTGDWTTKLHRHTQRDTVRPAWINGPFPSPYDSADAYDNQILVASGIGITPALSVIRAHKDSRRINLIWAVRDPHLLEFFLRHLYLDHEGWNLIFYTGTTRLRMPNMDILTNTNVCIVEGRPKLHEVIPNIIFGIESGQGLPENYTPTTRAVASELLADRLIDLNSNNQSTGVDAAAEDLAGFASELGFHLPTEGVSQSFDLFMSNEMRLERTRTSRELMSHLSIGFRPWDKFDGAKDYVKRLDPKLVLPTWGILYCGGAKKVLAELEKISADYGIGLHVESFEW